VSTDARAAAVRPERRREDAQERALAGAVRAEQRNDLAGPDLQVDLGKRRLTTKALRQRLCTNGRMVLGLRARVQIDARLTVLASRLASRNDSACRRLDRGTRRVLRPARTGARSELQERPEILDRRRLIGRDIDGRPDRDVALIAFELMTHFHVHKPYTSLPVLAVTFRLSPRSNKAS
jgi:hypothetical protein